MAGQKFSDKGKRLGRPPLYDDTPEAVQLMQESGRIL